LPEKTVEALDGNGESYRKWRDQGLLTVTDGDIIDFNVIKDDIVRLCLEYGVSGVGYDPHQATMLVTQLQEEGIPVIEFRPTVLNFSEPMKTIEALTRSGGLMHNGDEVMTWAMSNVVAKSDAKDNVYPRKERDENKIDPFVALCMAMGLAMTCKVADIDGWLDNMVIA
jgi:phage terminase large subunit-like protein